MIRSYWHGVCAFSRKTCVDSLILLPKAYRCLRRMLPSLRRHPSLPQKDVTNLWRHTMHNAISKQTKAELLGALRERYLRATKQEKTKVLDQFVAVARCHRKHAIRLL